MARSQLQMPGPASINGFLGNLFGAGRVPVFCSWLVMPPHSTYQDYNHE